MNAYIVQEQTLTTLADGVRNLTGKTEKIDLYTINRDVASTKDEMGTQSQIIEQIKIALQDKAAGSDIVLPTLTNPASRSDTLLGKEFIDQYGNAQAGTIPSQSATTIIPSTSTQTAIPRGTYAAGNVTVEAIPDQYQDITLPLANLNAVNGGATVATIYDAVDNTEAHASNQEALIAQIVEALEGKAIDELEPNEQATPVISVSDSGLITANAGTKTATRQLTTQGAQTITPGTSDRTISSGRYLIGDQTIKGDANLVAANIKSGKSIFGVSGTFTGNGKQEKSGSFTTNSSGTATVNCGFMPDYVVIINPMTPPSGYIRTATAHFAYKLDGLDVFAVSTPVLSDDLFMTSFDIYQTSNGFQILAENVDWDFAYSNATYTTFNYYAVKYE